MRHGRVAVSGATGFLGSSLCHAFLSRGYEVVALKRSTSNTARLAGILDLIDCHDIDRLGTEEFFTKLAQIDAVVHTATNYGRQGESELEIEQANLDFPLDLLRAAIKNNVSAFINTGTILGRELNQYAETKAQFVAQAAQLVGDSDTKFVNIKLQQMFGPWDDDSKFPARLIRQCMNNIPSFDLTEGNQLRDFIYIDDVVSGYCCIVEQISKFTLGFHEVELGSGKSVSIRNFALLVKQLANSVTDLRFGVIPYRDREAILCCANTNAMKQLGWACKVSLKEGILKTIEQEQVI